MDPREYSVRSIAHGVLQVLSGVVRFPLLALLLLLAPIVEVACGGLLLLGIIVSVVFEVSGAGVTFPFWSMIGLSVGFGLFLIAYHAIIGLLSR
jgi:hypothetical protein